MRTTAILILVFYSSLIQANDEPLLVKVADPYLEVYTGPGRGYPIFYTVARGDWVEILYRQTDWYKVKTEDDKVGWVDAGQLAMTLNPSGNRVDIKNPGEEDFKIRNWEYGTTIGDFEGAAIMTVYAAYHFTENISTELLVSQATGNASSNTVLGAQVVHQLFPEWKLSPFVALGTGWLNTRPKSTVVGTSDRTNQYANYTIGVRMHLTKRFLLRAEYRENVVFTSRNENEDITEWKAGFGFFF